MSQLALPGFAAPPQRSRGRVILSYGMGVDSTAVLLRWLEEPASRSFDLADLVVVTAMTGDEHASTGRLVRLHVLPRLARAGVRLVQIARAGPSEIDGIKVLDDSRAPRELYLAGAFKLSDELLAAGTVPQFAHGRRLCSIKQKGVPLDTWIAQETQGRPFRHVMGFNADELRRVARDRSYSTVERRSEYPLVGWGWGRALCEAYIQKVVGESWAKSSCTYCPFSRGSDDALARMVAEPAAALQALQVETVSLSLNPRATLYASGSLASRLSETGHEAPLASLEAWRNSLSWAVYRVRRAFRAKGMANRAVEVLAQGRRSEMEAELGRRAAGAGVAMGLEGGYLRAYTIPLEGASYPAPEEMLVAAPLVAQNKSIKGFEKRWRAALANTAARRSHQLPTSNEPPPDHEGLVPPAA